MKFNRSKLLILMAALIAMVLSLVGCGNNITREPINLKIATGSINGIYHPLGEEFETLFKQNIPDVKVSVLKTKGSVENLMLLKANKANVAIVQNDIVYYAMNGTHMFEGNKVEDLKGLATLYPEPVQIVVPANSPIQKVEDLKGKTISVGIKGNGSEVDAMQILSAYGLTEKDVKILHYSIGDSIKAYKAGKVDAVFITAGLPMKAVHIMSKSKPVRLLEVDDVHAKKLMDQYPFYDRYVVPANSYVGAKKETYTVAVRAVLVANSSVSETAGYDMVKAIFTHLPQVQAVSPMGKYLTFNSAISAMPLKFNGGAEKYFKDAMK